MASDSVNENVFIFNKITLRLIHAYGKPVGVSNAGRNRWPRSWASWSKWSSYELLINKLLFSEARIWAETRPPSTLMLHCSSKRKEKGKENVIRRKIFIFWAWLGASQLRYQKFITILVKSNTSATVTYRLPQYSIFPARFVN